MHELTGLSAKSAGQVRCRGARCAGTKMLRRNLTQYSRLSPLKKVCARKSGAGETPAIPRPQRPRTRTCSPQDPARDESPGLAARGAPGRDNSPELAAEAPGRAKARELCGRKADRRA